MKKFILTLIGLISSLGIYAQNNAIFDKPPYEVIIRGEEQIVKWISNNYEFSTGESLEKMKELTDKIGEKHIRYQYLRNGYPVLGSVLIAHINKDGNLRAVSGKLYRNISGSSGKSIQFESALESAKNSVGAKHYYWESELYENMLKKAKGDRNATYRPSEKLMYVPVDGNFDGSFRLAYEVELFASEPDGRFFVYVDAATNEILWKYNGMNHGDAVGTAVTMYNDTVSITVDSIAPDTFLLRDYSRGDGLITLNLETNNPYEPSNRANAIDFIDTDNFWNNVNAAKDEVATDAHFGAEATYDYFLDKHGRNSYNGNGGKITTFVHADFGWSNASWNGNYILIGDGPGGNAPYAVLDILGHEIAHGVTQETGGLIYQDESGALSESYSDIFGVAVDAYVNPETYNYQIGEQLGFTLRDMSNPGAYDDPDTYFGNAWYTGSGDNGGVHTNSGVMNYWFYLLAEGGSGTNDLGNPFEVDSMGIDFAGEIAYRTLSVYLTSNSGYLEARKYGVQSAIDLYGECSYEVKQVTNAWYAVGVGEPYDTVVTANFNVNKSFSCSFPTEVSFLNKSTNFSRVDWTLHNGVQTTLDSFTVTIDTPGTYSIELIASNSVSCFVGPDTLTKVLTFYDIGAPPAMEDCEPNNTSYCCETGITNFKLNGINNSSQDGNVPYEDFTCEANTILTLGKPYEYNIITGDNILEVVKIYLDMDYDGVFDPATELIDSVYGVRGMLTDTILIPKNSGAVLGHPLRLRVMSDIATNKTFGPCDTTLYKGQAEDYTVALIDDINYPFGVKEEATFDFNLYPNPANSSINISSAQRLDRIIIWNLQGALVKSVDSEAGITEVKLGVSEFERGVYFVEALSGNMVTHRKFIKK